MSGHKIKKFIVSFLITGLVGLPPVSALAIGLAVPVADPNNGLLIEQIGGLSTTATEVGAITALVAAHTALKVKQDAFFAGDKAVSFGIGGLALISGGASLTGQITAKITKIQGFIVEEEALRIKVEAVVPSSVFIVNQKQTLINSIDANLASLKAREEPLQAQLTLAQQGFWKTLVYNILIKTTQSVSTRLLSHLVSNYKIQNFAKYADAVATMVYDNQFIQESFPNDNNTQAIMRSMLSNPLAQKFIQPAVYQRANAAVNFDYKSMDTNDPNYYLKMAQVGNINPYLDQAILASQAQQIHAKSLATAQAEIATSNGLKTPMNCAGALSQQKGLDQSYKAANDTVANRQGLLNQYQNVLSVNGQNLSPADLQKLNSSIQQTQKDLAAAQAQLTALPAQVDSFALTICSGIVSPPSLINQGINKALDSIGQNLGNYNNNNLPYFITAITSIANQYINNLIFGGQTKGTILNETIGTVATAAGLALQYAANEKSAASSTAASAGISFTVTAQGNNDYLLNWNVATTTRASYVTIAKGIGFVATQPDANGAPVPIHFPLSGSGTAHNVLTSISSDSDYEYQLNIYDANNTFLSATMADIPKPQVSGAFIAKPSEPIRNWQAISPRAAN